ncbi:MAG: tetratricopeptide repeat protein, partial [Geminicoccaceae bacterium]
MTKVSCKSLLVYGALIICAVVVSLDRGGVQAAGTDPTSTQVAGPGVLDLPKEVEPTVESMLGDYLAGNFALDSGNIKDAVSYFQRALADDPDNLELRRQVFLLDLADGRYDAALEEARALKRVETEAINEDAQLLLALESVKQQAFEDVPEVLKDIGDQGIVALAAPFVLAWSSISVKGETGADAAIALLHGGESLGPLNDYHEALLLGFSGRVDEALNKLTDIV